MLMLIFISHLSIFFITISFFISPNKYKVYCSESSIDSTTSKILWKFGLFAGT